ncbi:MAG TPA: hypothetical protein PKA05_16005 [Roseiflexaceae bacterium]|nr:hypothetical protein [Roseiflexaceae bacterium]HMP41885.1 hypothetical protein [Roseiflexaceae bacterium]
MVLLVGILATAIAITTPGPAQQASTPPPAAVPVPHFIDVNAPGEPRVVVVGTIDTMLPGTSNTAGLLMAHLLKGNMPEGARSAMVLNDLNCAPDADGISHCLNDLDIDGVIVTVQHHHAMAEVPCLSPGEVVNLMTWEQYQRQV